MIDLLKSLYGLFQVIMTGILGPGNTQSASYKYLVIQENIEMRGQTSWQDLSLAICILKSTIHASLNEDHKTACKPKIF